MIFIAIGSFSSLILIFFSAVELNNFFKDRRATRMSKKYCRMNGLHFKEIKLMPGCYGLDFEKDGNLYHVVFRLNKYNQVIWLRNSPLKELEKRQKGKVRRRIRQLEKAFISA